MVSSDFDVILQSRLSCIQNTLAGKAKEYAGGGDRLHNFKVAARIAGSSPEEALRGMMLKHLVSVFDLIEDRLENTSAMVNEKVGDTINYLILLEAVLAEARAGASEAHDWCGERPDNPAQYKATMRKLMPYD